MVRVSGVVERVARTESVGVDADAETDRAPEHDKKALAEVAVGGVVRRRV